MNEDTLWACYRALRALQNIKAFTDAYQKGNITLTVGNDDFDAANSVYDVSCFVGSIQNFVCEGLDLPIPDPKTFRR